jgi:tetratricopeptide (TPR) repeat protein
MNGASSEAKSGRAPKPWLRFPFHAPCCLLLAFALGGGALGQQERPTRLEDETSKFSLRPQNNPREASREDDLPVLRPLEAQIAGNEFQALISGLTQYVKDHPGSARAHYDLGYVFFRTHQVGDSIRELSRSLALNVDDAEAHKTLGLACTFVGRYDLAETELQAAAKLEPNSAEIHYLLGRAYYTRGVYPLTKQELETAIRIDPSYMKAYNNLGLVLDIMGKNDEAVKAHETAARLNEEQKLNSPWPNEYLCAHYVRGRQPELAIEYARKAIAIDPKLDLAYFQMAKAFEYEGKWKECGEAAQQAIALDARTADYFYVLSVALRRQGMQAESQAALKKFEELHQKEQADTEMVKKARQQSLPKTSASPRDEH